MQKQFEAAGVDRHTRIRAVCPAELHLYDIVVPPHLPAISPSEYCCTLSHLKAIWTAYKAGADTALIMEDDVRIIRWPASPSAWKVISKSAPDDWRLLQMVSLGDIAMQLMSGSSDIWVPWESGLWCTGAYFINREGMQEILSKYVPDQISASAWATDDLVRVNFSTMKTDDARARCVADWALYVAATTYTCTDIFLTEIAEDSTLNSRELQCHRLTTDLVCKIASKNIFKLQLN